MAWGDDSEFGRWQVTDISPSKLAKWMTCPRQFWYRYVDPRRLPTFLGPWLPMGSALHEVVLEEYLAGGIDDSEALRDLVVSDFIIRCKTQDIYENGEPISEASIMRHADDLSTCAYGLIETLRTGKDPYGEPFELPPIKATEVEVCYPVDLKDGTLRVRGMADMMFEDDTYADLKMASDWNKVIWKIGKAITEIQPMAYSAGNEANRFTYTILDKCKDRSKTAISPRIRNIEFELTPKSYERFTALLENFARSVDLFGTEVYKDGVFPATPAYKGETFKSDVDKPEVTFCGHLCDYKEHCFRESFDGARVCGV